MDAFNYTPTDVEIAKLHVMMGTEGWIVFQRIMAAAHNSCGADAINALDSPGARPVAYYKGYLDSLTETIARIEALVGDLKERRQEENRLEREGPARAEMSAGDTAS